MKSARAQLQPVMMPNTLKKFARRRHLVLNMSYFSYLRVLPPPPPILGAQRWEQHLKEYKESLQKKATAAGFDRPIDYLWHEREKDPRYCRISYEMYKKCLSEKETMCEFMRNNCPQFK
ncbi:hypothetical protein CsSME_00000126 [Camellia sinensis var. sinensis]